MAKMRFTEVGQWLDQSWFGRLFSNLPGSSWQNWQIGGNRPVWIDTKNLWKVYAGIPHLNIVINKRAELFSLGKFRMRKISTGEEITKHALLTLMQHPNVLQSGPEFLTQYLVFKDIYAQVPIYKLSGLGIGIPSALWNLPPALFKAIPTGKLFQQTKLKDIIAKYQLSYQGQDVDFKTEEIIFKNDNLGVNYIVSESKIIALAKTLSNLEGSLSTANVLIQEHGAYGVLSNSSKDETGGVIPLSTDERRRIEAQETSDYGNKIGQRRKIITNASLSWTPMTFPMKDMLLIEQNMDNFLIVLGAYGVDKNVFPMTTDPTFENKSRGMVATIQNTIQPEADDLCSSFNFDFQLHKEDLECFMTYDHLPVMQENKVEKENVLKLRSEWLTTVMELGLVDAESAAEIMGLELSGSGPAAKSDSLGKIPLALQQLDNARAGAIEVGDTALANRIQIAMTTLTTRLIETIEASN